MDKVSMQRITRFAFLLEFSDMRAADEFGEAEDWGTWTLEKTPGWKIGQPLHGKAVGVMTAARKLKEDSEEKMQGWEPRWVRRSLKMPDGVDVSLLPAHYPVAACLLPTPPLLSPSLDTPQQGDQMAQQDNQVSPHTMSPQQDDEESTAEINGNTDGKPGEQEQTIQ